MAKMFPDVPVDESVEIYRSFHRDNFGEMIHVFPGMSEVLGELQAKCLKLGLVTSRLVATTQQGLTQYGLTEFFPCMITADDTKKHKPDPEPLQLAMAALGARAENTIYIGDTQFDIDCAKNAGVRSVLVDWTLTIPEEQKTGPEGPDAIMEKAEDLLELL